MRGERSERESSRDEETNQSCPLLVCSELMKVFESYQLLRREEEQEIMNNLRQPMHPLKLLCGAHTLPSCHIYENAGDSDTEPGSQGELDATHQPQTNTRERG